jgi:hypothetical protein
VRTIGEERLELFHVGERALPPGERLRPNAVPLLRAELVEAVQRALAGDAAATGLFLGADGRLLPALRDDPETVLVLVEAVFERERRRVAGDVLARDASLVAVRLDLGGAFADEAGRLAERAVRYWSADDPIEWPELLVRGTALVHGPV